MGGEAYELSRPIRIGCCCTSTWRPVTAARPGASSAIGRSRWSTHSYWTSWACADKKRRRMRGKLIAAPGVIPMLGKLALRRQHLRRRRSIHRVGIHGGKPGGRAQAGIDSCERELAVGAPHQQGGFAATLGRQQRNNFRLHINIRSKRRARRRSNKIKGLCHAPRCSSDRNCRLLTKPRRDLRMGGSKHGARLRVLL